MAPAQKRRKNVKFDIPTDDDMTHLASVTGMDISTLEIAISAGNRKTKKKRAPGNTGATLTEEELAVMSRDVEEAFETVRRNLLSAGGTATKQALRVQEELAEGNDDEIPEARMQNVVATIELVDKNGDCVQNLNVMRLAHCHWLGLNFTASRFPAATMHIINPSATMLLFSTGRVVVTGAQSIDLTQLACYHLERIMRNSQIDVFVANFHIEMVVFAAWTHWPIKLDEMDEELGALSDWEPEKFSGIRLRGLFGNIVLTGFRSGKFNLVGCKDVVTPQHVWRLVYTHVLRYFRDYTDLNSNSSIYNKHVSRMRRMRNFNKTFKCPTTTYKNLVDLALAAVEADDQRIKMNLSARRPQAPMNNGRLLAPFDEATVTRAIQEDGVAPVGVMRSFRPMRKRKMREV